MRRRSFLIVCVAVLVLLAGAPAMATRAADMCFPQTGKCVGERFYQYWLDHGGLAQQGYPITNAFSEVVTAEGPLKGKSLTVQYFERARFEYHPEVADPQYQVLLGLVGGEQFRAKYPDGAPAKSSGCTAGEGLFPNSNFCVPGYFVDYWRTHGGLAQQGYPISRSFVEKNPSNGLEYTVQYFERARFEYHPENDAENQVLLGLLGGEQFRAKYPHGEPAAAPAPPVAPPPGSAVPFRVSGVRSGPSQTFTLHAGLVIFHNSYTGSGNFITHLIDSRLNTVCYVSNDIGTSKSSSACSIPANGTYRFDVTSSGSWTIEGLQPGDVEFAAATQLGARFTGTGDQVSGFFVARAPGVALGQHYSGKGNFIVHVLDTQGKTVGYGANEIGSGSFNSLVRLPGDGVYFLEVTSSGQWSIDVVQHSP